MAGTTNYPTALDSHTGGNPYGMAVVANNLTTTLTATVGAADTTLTVTSVNGFATRSSLVIGSEVITYTGTFGGNQFTGCTRGVDGTTAVSHVAGVIVANRPVAANLNDLAAAVVAIQTKLGTGALIAASQMAAVDHVLAYRSTGTLTFTNVTEATVTFDIEQYDSNTMHDNSTNTGRLTCKTAGLYEIFGQITYDPPANGTVEAYIRLNGSTRIATYGPGYQAGQYVPVRRAYRLAVNDYVELRGYQGTGGNLNAVNGALYTFFGMRWVSA